MARLFSAVELPDAICDELDEPVAAARVLAPDLTWSSRKKWHITLGFYGETDDVDTRIAWFRERAAKATPARVRLRAAGGFPGVLWVDVESPDAALHALAGTLTDQEVNRQYVPHVTIARGKRDSAESKTAATRAAAAFDGYCGQWWLTDEVVLLSSDQTPEGHVYTALDRVALADAPGKQS
jgi:2'-5' RNA ligase